MTPSTEKQIRKLLTSARNVASATNEDARVAARGFMIKRALELCSRRDILLEKIELGEAYQAHIDAEYPIPNIWEERVNRYERIKTEHPGYAEREEKFASWCDELKAITDALDAAADLWGGPIDEAA